MVKITIKNMVCPRCVMAVRDIITSMGYDVIDVSLGSAVIDCNIDDIDLIEVDNRLHAVGFELIFNDDLELTENIKMACIELARSNSNFKLSTSLEEKFKMNYQRLSYIFKQNEDRTIANFYIYQRIEYVKELLGYPSLTLTDIAFKTGYSSVAYLSRQFRQCTGITITEYLNSVENNRKSLTDV